MRLILLLVRWLAGLAPRARASWSASTPTQRKITALFAVLVALVGLYSYMYAQVHWAGAEEVTVAVATENLVAPKTLSELDVENVVLPRRGVPEGALAKADLIGKVLMDSVEKKEMILKHNVQIDTDPTSVASSDLFKRYFAVNIDINWLNSSLPDLRPGDTVSLLTSVQVPARRHSSARLETQMVASAARVIQVTDHSLTVNVTETEVNQLLVTRSLNLPLQVVVHPNKVEALTK